MPNRRSDDPRVHPVTVRLSQAERSMAERRKPRGMTMSDWLRDLMLGRRKR